jgi:hypothetical protein
MAKGEHQDEKNSASISTPGSGLPINCPQLYKFGYLKASLKWISSTCNKNVHPKNLAYGKIHTQRTQSTDRRTVDYKHGLGVLGANRRRTNLH